MGNNNNYQEPEELLRDADLAMYKAKQQGLNYACFEPLMHPRAVARLQLEYDLKRAIELQQLQLYYQPLVSLTSGQICGFEALLRWHHPQQGWISPEQFILIAEETGMIRAIDWWVLQQATHQLRTWQHKFPDLNLELHVNISALQLKQDNLVHNLECLFSAIKLSARNVKLEITETSFLETANFDAAIFRQLQALGISLCIDDFGTGYSSLSRLHNLPLDTIKIDRSFVNGIDTDGTKAAIAQAIITLGHHLGAIIISEGVETLAQCACLKKLGCEFGQGYLFSKPLDAEGATSLIESRTTYAFLVEES